MSNSVNELFMWCIVICKVLIVYAMEFFFNKIQYRVSVKCYYENYTNMHIKQERRKI